MERIFYIWLNDFLNISDDTKRKLLKKYKSPKAIFELSEKKLRDNGLLCEKNIGNFIKSKKEFNEKRKNEIIEVLENKKVNTLNYNDENYYNKLKNIYDFPYNLYYKGNIYEQKVMNDSKVVAIVGSRDATSRGLDLAYRIAYDLAKAGVIIISGMARGIDSFAHNGALAASGKTIAILGSGIDVCYPSENIGLMKQIEKEGMLISEYYLGTKPYKENFPKRNRIISALADFVLVVEAAEKSGSLITANVALEQGKDVGAIPGNVFDKHYVGTNVLIKEGAYLIRDAKDILDIIK